MKPRRAFSQESRRTNSINCKEGDTNASYSFARQLSRQPRLPLFAATSTGALAAEKKYDTGATDTEIKVGNIMPYSGPASAYGIIGKTEAAYFKKINDAGRHQRPQDQLHQL